MEILLLLSQNKHMEALKELLSSRPYAVESLDRLPPRLDLDRYSLAVIDITGCNKETDFPLSFYQHLCQGGLPLLVIAETCQSELLLKPEFKFEDVVFISSLADELMLRLDRMMVVGFKKILGNSLSVGELVLNMDKYELTVKNMAVELTYKEYELLKLLLENQNHAFSRDQLLSIIWDYDFYGGSRTVDVHIRRLRSKLPPPYNLMLKTVRNVGYMFSPDLTQI